MRQEKILFIFGIRPEAIKLAPVIKKFSENIREFKTVIVVTAQHREMLDQVLQLFQICPDYDLNTMTHDQTLSQVTAKALEGLDRILVQERPDIVFVLIYSGVDPYGKKIELYRFQKDERQTTKNKKLLLIYK